LNKRNQETPIKTWEEIKTIIRKRSIPIHYYKELFQKLQSINQGCKSVDDYHKKIKIVMIHVNIVKDKEATMIRFCNGLNQDLANIVKL